MMVTVCALGFVAVGCGSPAVVTRPPAPSASPITKVTDPTVVGPHAQLMLHLGSDADIPVTLHQLGGEPEVSTLAVETSARLKQTFAGEPDILAKAGAAGDLDAPTRPR